MLGLVEKELRTRGAREPLTLGGRAVIRGPSLPSPPSHPREERTTGVQCRPSARRSQSFSISRISRRDTRRPMSVVALTMFHSTTLRRESSLVTTPMSLPTTRAKTALDLVPSALEQRTHTRLKSCSSSHALVSSTPSPEETAFMDAQKVLRCSSSKTTRSSNQRSTSAKIYAHTKWATTWATIFDVRFLFRSSRKLRWHPAAALLSLDHNKVFHKKTYHTS